jgi:signal transduction histidine kinase
MTEVIDAVKGQAVSMNASTMTNFTIKEFITRAQLLMRNELKRRHCNLNLDITANEDSEISGEISALIQVIDNMIINAMDAYGDVPGNVDIKVREDDTKVYIDVTDYAGGIPQKVQDKLFKEMITSKGKNGTGLGLYMSFSTIKGKFKGDIRFETEEGKGTTFFIELPKYVG